MEIRNSYEKAIQLINSSNTLALSAIDEYGYPKIYAMEKVVSEDLNKIIFITKRDSNKVRLLNINNKCCVELHTEDDSVCLKGNIEIQEDDETKRKILPSQYVERLERSGMQRYCVLIFTTITVDLYIDGEFDHT
ncbi:pyridoxamine 5'-phosphate oxidase family protein [Cellulosilyticum sp. ST5]|uniref:pyridoxamine 5'-phosphate oxidase family protein n=1 Tax=unclassified Cellulosilyticum TaxID=2643091 RepID=UPI000F8F69B0|nr:pyridoxamine 5'-phosphate oxidase family protein [Cellulosilyticum sp. WCF-2]QEH67831.1 hypothetical protein EKH84_05205 [Cellulosilyticum sp. WCF-2]